MVTSWPRATSSAVARRAQPDPLARRRPAAEELEDLLARHGDLDRLLQLARGERRQDGLGVDAQLGAEAAADEGGHDRIRSLSSRSVLAIAVRASATICEADVDRQVVAARTTRQACGSIGWEN